MAVIQSVARRTDDSKLTDWYFGTDRWLLLYVGIMIFIGMIAAISTGSANSIRVNGALPWYHFVVKMLPFYVGGLGTLFITSMFNKKGVLYIAWLNVIICMLLLFVTLVHPHVLNGSTRWVMLGGVNLMPSDIMKPGFVIITAWFLTQMKSKYGSDIFLNKDAFKLNWISWWSYACVFCVALGIMFLHPDFGTSVLYFAVLGIMLIVAGLPKRIIVGMFGIGALGVVVAFFLHPHVHERIVDFFGVLDPTSQVGLAVNAIRQGGLFGMGDEAFAAEHLAMAENDFVFAALVEDFGAIMGCALLALIFLVIRRLKNAAAQAHDKFVVYAITGAMALFSVQACMNLATTLHMMPAKGMTLPFISFGGSSFLGFCLLFGLILALIRQDKWQ